MYTYKIEQAIRAASILHENQLRKGSVPIPYISHLMGVVLILRDYTTDEDILAAAMLHDTLEDTDYTLEELKEDFGGPIAEIVLAVTEPKMEGERKLSWIDKKRAYAKQLRKAPEAALMIAAADKAHNFRSIVEEYYDAPERYVQDFGSNIEQRIEAYQNIANAINSRLRNKILHEFNHTFEEYKQFLFHVQKASNHVD